MYTIGTTTATYRSLKDQYYRIQKDLRILLDMKSDAAASRMVADKFSTSKPWYFTTLGNRLGSEAREMLEEYSHIPSAQVDEHVYKMLSDLAADGSSTLSPHRIHFVDTIELSTSVAGSGVLRRSRLYGTDYNPSFLKSSYKIFNDEDSNYTLIPANILDPNFFQITFRHFVHKFSIIHAALFMHLFTWEQQLQVCENVVKLMIDQEGALFVGCMVGKRGGGEAEQGRWLHDEDSWLRLWGEVWERLGTTGSWKVQGELRELGDVAGDDSIYYRGEGIGLFEFSVERTGESGAGSRTS
ncbi:methyltransferase domain-containing protein [Rutstroemia sp. NJR-2017a WRK4]|nr:methyltransferase domain-containing protein [Rutstroemia sp. NJR-2017a WRK4]